MWLSPEGMGRQTWDDGNTVTQLCSPCGVFFLNFFPGFKNVFSNAVLYLDSSGQKQIKGGTN